MTVLSGIILRYIGCAGLGEHGVDQQRVVDERPIAFAPQNRLLFADLTNAG